MFLEEKVASLAARARNVLADDSGANLVEYGLLLAGIAAITGGAVVTLSGGMTTLLDGVNTALTSSITKVTTLK